MLTGCQDRPYAFGLAMALVASGVSVEVVGSDEIDSPDFHTTPGLKFLNLRGRQRQRGAFRKAFGLVAYYLRLITYAARSRVHVIHILWNNRLQWFDRTVLTGYFRLLGKHVVLTAHNVNQAKRDANDTLLNRRTLRAQYRAVHHLFVHTDKMKHELLDEFGVPGDAVTVLKHPINDAFPDTGLTPLQARLRLGIAEGSRTLLFLGRIRPYKGLGYLVEAFDALVKKDDRYRLIIAGEPKKGEEEYFAEIRRSIEPHIAARRVVLVDRFIADAEMELFLRAADALVLPYIDISQSGVLFLAFTFGLPAIASDVGSFREVVVDGQTGVLCRPMDSGDLARAIEKYFGSSLFMNLGERRGQIAAHFKREHSWEAVAVDTLRAYNRVLGR
jgi:glycosyltransferase involved in cell wall biosynthesis